MAPEWFLQSVLDFISVWISDCNVAIKDVTKFYLTAQMIKLVLCDSQGAYFHDFS